MKELQLNCKIAFGEGSLKQLDKLDSESVLIITDASMVQFGAYDRVVEMLGNRKISTFQDVIPDPPVEIITAGVKVLQESDADTIIAVGGGSVIDAAKAVRMIGAKILGREATEWDFVAIPTTSGTGSEVTDYSVITNREKEMKYPLVDPDLMPTLSLLDPVFTVSVPPAVTADTGMDALSHALEAYVSLDANEFTDAFCEKAIAMIFEYLPRAVKDGKDMEARQKMQIAACMAGIAFNAVGLGINHGMSHAIGGKFHISHGRSNAMLLPIVIRYNGGLDDGYGDENYVAAKKYQKIAKMLGLQAGGVRQAVRNLSDAVAKMNRTMGVPATLVELGKNPAEVEANRENLIASAIADATTQTNPRPVTPEDAGRILTQLKGK